eukprot:6174173-Pleurochrysis_carterae.AAC.1
MSPSRRSVRKLRLGRGHHKVRQLQAVDEQVPLWRPLLVRLRGDLLLPLLVRLRARLLPLLVRLRPRLGFDPLRGQSQRGRLHAHRAHQAALGVEEPGARATHGHDDATLGDHLVLVRHNDIVERAVLVRDHHCAAHLDRVGHELERGLDVVSVRHPRGVL